MGSVEVVVVVVIGEAGKADGALVGDVEEVLEVTGAGEADDALICDGVVVVVTGAGKADDA